MATTLNMVTVGNDFVLRVKVGMVQYSNNSVQWDYMDLTTCRNIVFNISCTKHDIDINLPYTIDQTDHAVISATVRAEMLHENSIYNFSITGIDSEGYRWTYISPKQQSFVTTSVSQDSANAYTELAFTAGMIMPLAARGKNGFTPYIGQNNHWWINGEDTGVSAVGDIDLSDYATKEYVDDAIENIDIPETDLTNYYTKSETDEAISDAIKNIDISDMDTSDLVKKEDISNGSYLDWEGWNLPALDTGIYLDDNLRFEIDLQRIDYPNHYLEHAMVITGGRYTDEYGHISALFQIGSHLEEGFAVLYGYDVRGIFNDDDFDRHLISFNLHDGVYCDGQYVEGSGTEDSLTERILNDGYQIPMISLNYGYTNNLMVYNIKIYNGDTLLRDYVPVTPDDGRQIDWSTVHGNTNGDGYYDKVSGSYMLKDNLECKQYYKYLEDIENVKNELNSNLVKKEDIIYGNYVDGNNVNLDTGVALSDTLRFVIEYQRYDGVTSTADDHPTISAFSNDNMYFVFGGSNEAIRVYYPDIMDCEPANSGLDFNKHTIEWSLSNGVYFDNEHVNEGTQDSVISRVTNNGDEIPNIVLYRSETNHIALYNVKIYDGDTLLRDYEPVTTENGNGYHDKVNDTYLLSNDLTYHDFYRFPEFHQYKHVYDDINKINNIDLWGPVNEIYNYTDITADIDKILNNDTITTGTDIQSLWEVVYQSWLRKALPVYKKSPVTCKRVRDDENQRETTWYRFWNIDDNKYYTVEVHWTYSIGGDGDLYGNILSTSYSTTEYATKRYVDNAIQNIPGGSTPDLSNYVTTSYLNSNYYDKQTSDENLDTLFNDTLESTIYNNPAQYIPHSTVKFLGTTNRIKIYDIFKCEENSLPLRSSNGFKVGILYNEEEFQYKSLSDLTYDNHVNINIWWKTITTEGNTSYEYFDTTFELTTANNNISFNLVEQGDDMLGHYIIVDIEGAYFGAVETVSDITTYTGSEDTTGITINQSAGTAGVYDPATLKVTVLSKYYQNNANATILTIIPYLKNYALKSEIPSIQTMTQAQYDELVANNTVNANTLYIIL